ncbi:DNA-3-methyladenine glycosylase I [Candidatus Bathyarchaeota archaeon]|nr:DNA-3-methyladenine glycosylase I [Candidatus Bathyarchaeota archaeon]
MHKERSIPDWVFHDKRPETDREYFMNLTRVIFQAGMSWQVVASKWEYFLKAFDNFDIEVVSSYGVEDSERLRNDAGIIRNKQKIQATIENAEVFKRVSKEHGSFRKWLDYLDKSNNYDYVVKRLISMFSRVGKSTAHIFLWSVGEPIKYDESVHSRKASNLV